MKLHLPVLLRKALLACFSFTFACTCSAAAADLTLGNEDSLTIDYADIASIPDLENGTLQLNGDTLLLLSNCGVGDGKAYTLLTGVSVLLDAEGNAIVLDSSNNAISHYFDTTRPGTGFWGDSTLVLDTNGNLLLVRHNETVKAAQDITSRQTYSLVYNYYERISFKDIAYSPSYGFSDGGAIDGSIITLSNNGSVVFDGNTVSSGSYDALGGAIYGYTITLSNNGSVVFDGNTASSGSYDAWGGAIKGTVTITLSNNGSVVFDGNTASSGSYDALGGAIFAGSGSTLKINNNGETIFRGNYAYTTAYNAEGGAIYKQPGIFAIQNNASVVFEKNYTLQKETLRLQSICAFGLDGSGKELIVNFSAPEGGKIEFLDSIYIAVASNSSSAFHLNDWYVNDKGEYVAQIGDIIFTGEDATAENLKAILAEHGIYREATADEIRLSKTSEVWGTMQLHDGQLIVCDGAIIQADGITVYSSVSGKSTPTLWLNNGVLSSYLNSWVGTNSISISGGSALRLSGQNTARYSTLTMLAGSTLIIDVAATHADTAALTLDGRTLSLNGAIILQLNAAEGLIQGTSYQLLTGITAPSSWTTDNVTVKSGTEGWNVGFNDLTWVGNTLWLYYDTRPDLVTATWTNEANNRLWDTSSVNWEQDDIDYEYKNGVHVIFGDEEAGTVTLVGTLSPASVLVNSSEDYSFEGSGSLTGGMKLTKRGSGTLSISTANSYTGGTTIEAGTVAAKHAQALGTGVVTLAGGTLEIAVAGVGNTIANTGTSTLKVANGVTHALTGKISNSGELTFSGEFQTSGLGALSTREPATYENAAGEVDSTGGFCKSAIQGIQLTSGSGTTVNSNATIWHGSIDKLFLGTDGWATMGGEVSYVSYYVGSDHNVELDDIISTAAAKGISKTDIQLSGGILKANAELTGVLTAEGVSEIIADNWAVKTAFSNSGTLSISGTVNANAMDVTSIGATHIDANGADSLSGFTKDAGSKFTLVNLSGNGSIVDPTQVSIDRNGTTYVLGANGVAVAEGATHYDNYLVGLNKDGSRHEVELDDIISTAAAKGGNSTNIQLNGGILKANAELTGILTAEGTSEIVADNWQLNQIISNSGTLSISGTIDAAGMNVTSIAATHIDASGADSLSGFTKDAGSKFTLVNLSGNGSIVDPTAVSIDRNGTTYVLGANGEAVAEGATHYDNYLVGLNKDGRRHEVELDDIISTAAAKGISKTDIQLNGGILTANAALTGVLTAEGTSEIVADNWQLNQIISNSGSLSISGTIDAAGMNVTSIGATLIDARGADNLSGFTKDAGSKFTLVNLSGNGSIVDPTQVSIDRNGTTYVLGANGEAVAEGATHYGNYLVGLNKDGSRHVVELDDIIAAAAAKGVNSTNIQLSGGILKANAALTGVLTAEGTSEIIADNWEVSTAFSNSGTLSISGTVNANAMDVTGIDATHIDANGADSLSGFTKDAGSKFTLVNLSGTGSIVDPTQVAIDRNGINYVLGRDGVAIAEGTTHYDNYLVGLNKDNSRHEVELDDIIAAAATKGVNSTNIQLNGGILTANAALTGVLTAEGTSEIVADNWQLNQIISNSGSLSISGTIDAAGMNVTSIGATLIDARGADNLSGFTKDAGSKFTLVNLSGNGSIIDPSAVSIDRNGVTYILGSDGVAIAEGTMHYNNYLVGLNKDNSRHEVELDDIIAAAAAKGVNSTNIQLNGGILKANAELTGVLTAEGTSEIVADNWAVKTAFSNSGTLSISGTVNANAMDVTSIGATHIDASGADSLSGFTKDAGSKFTLVNLSGNGSIVDPTQVSIDRNGTTYLLGANGEAVAEGATHYDNYLVGLNKDGSRHEVELDDIISTAAAKGISKTDIQLNGGILKANAALTGVLTAEGTSAIIADNWEVKTAFSNSGTLSISGTIDAKNMGVESIGATHIDASGADSLSGFTKDAGSKFTLVNLSGNGSIVDPTQVSIDRNGTTYLLGANGEAVAEGATHYDNYLVGLNKDNSRHEVELDDIISTAAAKGVNSTNIQLNGGIVKANAALTGVLTAEGTSEIIADNWEVSTAFSNSGTLSISGTIDAKNMGVESIGATHIDASGADSLSGFTKDAGSKFTLVNLSGNGSIVDPTQVTIDRNDVAYVLGRDGVAIAEGATHYDNYLVGLNKDGSRHEVELDDIISTAAAKGGNSTNIQLSGGILKANAELTGVLTAEGVSEIIADNWAVKTAFSNSGTLSISGTVNANAMDVTSIGATHIDASGADSLSGFTKDAGSKFKLVNLSGNGSIIDPSAVSIDRNGVTYILGSDGVAIAEGTMHYNNYLVGLNKDNSRHEVELDDIIAAAAAKGVNSTNIQLNGGILKANAALTGVLTAEGTSEIIADNWEVSTAFSNSGMLSISGTIDAKNMGVESIGATLIDANGADSLSGFTKDAGSKFKLVNLSGNGSIVDPTQVSIDRNGTTYVLGANGVAIAEGTTHYNNYLVGLNKDNSRHEVELDDIISAAAAKGVNSTNIQLNGGIVKANAALTGVLTAEGTSEIVADNWVVKTAFSNSGTLTFSGTVNANAMDVTGIDATHIDANGADSLSGFTKDAGSKFTLVTLEGSGSIIDPTQVTIDRNGVAYVLGANGEAVAEGATHYDNYLVGLNKDNSRHEVALGDIISTAAAKGVNSTNIQLNGGILKANAALTGVLTAEGTSEIIADNWEVSTAFSNSGTLSISGTVNANAMDVTSIGATHIDANGADSLSGFTKDAGSKFTLVNLSGNGSIVDPTQVAIDRNGINYVLGRDGVAIAEGTTHYDNYLVGLNKDNSRHEVELDDIIAAAATKGVNSTNIQLNGGILTANAALTGVLTAEGTSEIVADNWQLNQIISNSGSLSISGTIDASALALDVTEAGRVSLSGADVSLSESGFARAAEYSVLLVAGGKTVNEGVSILHDDYRMRSELVLGEDGVARAGGGVDYSRFYLTGADAVSVSGVDAVSETMESDLQEVIMDGGVLEVDADITVDASGGSIVITDDSTLSGAIADTDITAAAGDYTSGISASISGGSKVTVDGGEVTLSGDNRYTGGTVIKGGCLTAGSDTAFGTGVIELNKGELNLNGKAAENDLLAKGGIISGGSGFRGAVVFNGAVGLRGNLSASAVTINQGSILTFNGSTISVSGSLTLAGAAVLNLNGSAFGAGDVLITFGSLSGSEELLTVDCGADSDKYTVEREGNSLILAWLEETQPEEEEKPEDKPLPPTKPEIPAPVLDRESCDALVQSSWGVFTASHAFADAIGGQRSAAGYVGGGRSTAWVSALGGMHRIDGTAAAAGSDIDLYGAAVGLEHFMTELDSVGLAVGNVRGDVKLKQSGRETEQDGTYIGVYGTHLLAGFDRNNWLSLKWSAVYGDTTTEGTVGQEKMSWKQDSVQLNARAEWTSQLNNKWSLSVFGGAEYFASDSAENEAGDSLRGRVTEEEERVRMGSIQNLRGELGIGTRYTDGSTTLYGEVRYLNDMVRSNPYADINGVRGYGANPGRQGIGVTVGAQQELGGGWSMSASYSLEAMSEATMHSANIGAALRF